MSDEEQRQSNEAALIERASHDVDRTLIRWALSLSPLERLRAATTSAASLEALRKARHHER